VAVAVVLSVAVVAAPRRRGSAAGSAARAPSQEAALSAAELVAASAVGCSEVSPRALAAAVAARARLLSLPVVAGRASSEQAASASLVVVPLAGETSVWAIKVVVRAPPLAWVASVASAVALSLELHRGRRRRL
jgi:hypothetical protein